MFAQNMIFYYPKMRGAPNLKSKEHRKERG